jgi:phosphate/phosphite/phosphonate ABC transporter binding protein
MFRLGYASGPSAALSSRRMTEFAGLLARLALVHLEVRGFVTYEELGQACFRGEVDFACLPPILFAALFSENVIVPLASVRKIPYQSAIIVAKGSPLERPGDLVGMRAAWVDRHSASGFVVPRIKLMRLGVDPRRAFSDERLYGSHDAVVQAVASGQADFGATWAQSGKTTRGPWTKSLHDVRVLATFGSIPPDVIAARADLDKPTRKSMVGALKSIYAERQSRWLVSHALGTEAFYRPDLELYGRLQESVVDAYRSGLLHLGADPTRTSGVERSLETRPRMASRMTIPDPVEEEDTRENPTWSLTELGEDEIEITFD